MFEERKQEVNSRVFVANGKSILLPDNIIPVQLLPVFLLMIS